MIVSKFSPYYISIALVISKVLYYYVLTYVHPLLVYIYVSPCFCMYYAMEFYNNVQIVEELGSL